MKILARLIIFTAYYSVLNGLAFAVTAPFLRDRGFAALDYGLASSIAAAAALTGTLVAGPLTDRLPAKPLLILSTILGSPSYAMVAQGDFQWVAAGFALSSFFGSISTVAGSVLVARIFKVDEYEIAYSYLYASNAVAGGVGGLLGWIPALLGGNRAYPVTLTTVSMLLPFSVTTILPLEKGVPVRESRTQGGGVREAWNIIAGFAVVEALIGFGAATSIHIIDFYFALKYGVSSAELGTIFGFESLAMGILMILMPRISEAVGSPLKAYMLVSGSSIPLLVAVTLVDDLTLAAALYIARTVLMNVASPLLQAFQMKLVPNSHRGRAVSIFTIAWQLPAVAGRSVGGYLMNVDVELPLRVTSVIYAVGLALLALLFRSRKEGR